MKSWLAIALLIGFVSLAVFGVAGMDKHGGGHGGCVAETAMGADCPSGESPLAAAIFHIKAFISFSTAVFGDAVGLMAILLAFTLALAGISLRDRHILAPTLAPQRLRAVQSTLGQKRQLHSWLALFEKRDPDLS